MNVFAKLPGKQSGVKAIKLNTETDFLRVPPEGFAGSGGSP